MIYKVGVKRFTNIIFDYEEWQVNGEYWTTVDAETESQAKRLAYKNLCVKMAKNEWFINNVRRWKSITLDKCDMVIG